MYKAKTANRWVIWACAVTGATLLSGCGLGSGTAKDSVGTDGATETGPACIPCEPTCSPEWECGYDGCGGVCAECPEYGTCLSHQCVDSDPRLCSGNCGCDYGPECPEGWVCANENLCEPAEGGCDDVSGEGACVNDFLARCEDDSIVYDRCDTRVCEVVDEVAQGILTPGLPNCFGKTCGVDGCGGVCGTCQPTEQCVESIGVCLPIDSTCNGAGFPRCEGQMLLTCQGGVVETQWCPTDGRICGVDECGGAATCHFPVPGTTCPDDLPTWGHCEAANYYYECVEDELRVLHCRTMHSSDCLRLGFYEYGCNDGGEQFLPY